MTQATGRPAHSFFNVVWRGESVLSALALAGGVFTGGRAPAIHDTLLPFLSGYDTLHHVSVADCTFRLAIGKGVFYLSSKSGSHAEKAQEAFVALCEETDRGRECEDGRHT
mmetsp:Transcript_18102/g.21007  ORF Transcript_18102/g.21007 Transcript_18102/m.21007 type:complete len:111 (+) Transcript_18102:31-363(+)